jgi:hypothetical protein
MESFTLTNSTEFNKDWLSIKKIISLNKDSAYSKKKPRSRLI